MTGLLHNNSCCEPINSTKRRSSKGSSTATRLSQDQMLLQMINSMSIDAREALSQQAMAELCSKNGTGGGKAATLLLSSSSHHHHDKKNKKKKKDLFHVQANEALPQIKCDGIRISNHSSSRRRRSSSRSARSTDSGTFKTGSDLDSGFYSISIHSSHSCD